MAKRNKRHKRTHHTRKRKSSKSLKRSLAAKKAWQTRIRREGKRKLIKILANIAFKPISKVRTAKDIAINTIKFVKPDLYMKSKALKIIDKL